VRISGVIEGFYGPPWTHAERSAWIDLLADQGMTHYVWAAKAEPRHRDAWREPFTARELAEFTELAHRRPTVTLAVGLTPGADATTDDVLVKLAPAVSAGAGTVVLSCDDLPALDAGRGHRDLAHALLKELAVPVWVVPTHYCGTDDSPYLQALVDGLDRSIELMWTGNDVVNDRIDASDAARRAELTGRPPLVWDNTPVNDALMREALHLGPLSRRDPALREVCSGVLWNPMEFSRASAATCVSAAAWVRGDDHEAAWRDHVDVHGWYELALATAFRGDPHWVGDDPSPEWWAAVAAGLPTDAAAVGLDAGVQPWLDAAAEGAAIALDALALLERLRVKGTGTGTTMRQFALAGRWRAWRRSDVLTFGGGPRVRPVLGQDHHGEFVGRSSSFELDESIVDALVRRALHS
jgi:hypothetical protein